MMVPRAHFDVWPNHLASPRVNGKKWSSFLTNTYIKRGSTLSEARFVPSALFIPEGSGNPLQYSCLVNPMHRGRWWALSSWGSQRVGLD